jgi:subtilase family serine protease
VASPPARRVSSTRSFGSRLAVVCTAVVVSMLGVGSLSGAGAAASSPELDDVVRVTQAAGGATHPLQLRVLGRGPDASPLLTGTGASGYTPAQVRSYLGLTGTGAGQTIAIVTAFDAPNVAKDLAFFNSTFGLPAPPSFRKVNQTGGTKYPPVDAAWALEAALDVQWAHAVAPAAHLLLVEATSNTVLNLMTAVSWATGCERRQRQLRRA